MQPKGIVPVTKELDDISYVCPKCGVESRVQWLHFDCELTGASHA